jgi:hypothetical protein
LREVALSDTSGFHAIPLPAAARLKSVTAIFPPNEIASTLFSHVGSVGQFTVLEPCLPICTLTGTLRNYYKLASLSVNWLQAQGIANKAAQAYTAGLPALRFCTRGFRECS